MMCSISLVSYLIFMCPRLCVKHIPAICFDVVTTVTCMFPVTHTRAPASLSTYTDNHLHVLKDQPFTFPTVLRISGEVVFKECLS